MIDLSNIEPFAKGGNRSCYQHPENINICLKITHPESSKSIKS
ncbi:MAG: mutated putative cytoplasmic protein [SAR86 cluster bacterium SAR86B]|uniref:Mutated putative cytoplasmic protein n=1 Tax=SAR86 cluster bacterium SAR86B TaxID=1123867 RepID=J4KT89_9GAMM|nr:MAG: mutated putative cytoplasmic protein [SAR86 cluster bacterium SAR86B]